MEFEISDTGPGIAPEHLERIFEPFERVPAASGATVPGIGLGLTITRLLVQILGGQVTVTSTPGAGSIFRVQLRLPAVAYRAVGAPASRPVIGYEGRPRTILAAEDNAVHRCLLQDALAPLGFKFLSVPDGASCLRVAEDCDVDLFLLDLSMPSAGAEIDGIEVARRLRRGRHAATPIIILSAHAPEIRHRPGTSTPYNAVLAKPIDIRRLLELIAAQLGLAWQYVREDAAEPPEIVPQAARAAMQPYLKQLRYLASIGFVRGIKETLARASDEAPAAAPLSAALLFLTENLKLPELISSIDELDDDAC
jgi:CheY-like chemotaxis protein